MTEDTRTTDIAPAGAYDSYPLQAPPDQESVASPLAAVHRHLRGRYVWALGIGGVLACAGLVLGYKLPRPMYRSTGIINIQPKGTPVVQDTFENAPIPLFDGFVKSEEALVRSARILEMARASEAWRKLGRTSDAERASFERSLDVRHPNLTGLIEVNFTDRDPVAAKVAATEIVAAYMKVVDERENETENRKLFHLEKEQSELNKDLKELREEEQKITGGYGEKWVQSQYDSELGAVNRHNSLLSDIDLAIATTQAADQVADTAKKRHFDDEEIALRDGVFHELLQQKKETEKRIKNLLDVDKLGVNHERVRSAQAELDLVRAKVIEHGNRFRMALAAGPEERAQQIELKGIERAKIEGLLQQHLTESKQLGQKLHELKDLADRRALKTEALERVKKRIDQIRVESRASAVHSRISVTSWPDVPSLPYTDRRVPMAILGGLGGMGLGFALVLLAGLRQGRLRHIDDVEAGKARGRFLGILPEVSETAGQETKEGLPSPDEMADFCVHHLRTMLQLRAAGQPRVIALTSPSAGDGKTTLGMALGMSFAAAGSRTLLVDCDLVGRGLTSAMRSFVCDAASRTLLAAAGSSTNGAHANGHTGTVNGLVALRRLRFDDGQVEELLAQARALDAPNGKRSLAGTIRTLTGLARPGSASAKATRRGLVAALEGEPLENCILELDEPNLSLLPVGDGSARDASSLSPTALQFLLASCRARYDTVLVDTGPVLGSLEAAMTASAADHVVVVVSRGGRMNVVEQALQRLERQGADVTGVVFNRAAPDDAAHSSYVSRSRSHDAEARP